MTGQVGLNLISHRTQTTNLSDSAMKAIGKLLMYVNDHVLPATPFPDVYNCTDEDELEYLKQFGKQLFLDESELKRFKFPAASLLVNDDLNPHEDLMNPHNIEMDYTLALSLVVPISEVLSELLLITFVSAI